jgi:hypothetical protein
MLRHATRPGKTAVEKWQVAYGTLAFFGLIAYVFVLLSTAFAAVARPALGNDKERAGSSAPAADTAKLQGQLQRRPAPSSATLPPDSLPGRSWWGVARGAAGAWARRAGEVFSLERMKTLIVVLSTVGLFSTVSLKALLQTFAAGTAAAGGYLATGERAARTRGVFGQLLQHVLETGADGAPYHRVHVVAFSFGSVVALDSIFPVTTPADQIRDVHTLVTIGCPFDFVRTYWPEYFGERRAISGVPATWLNIYARADVLGSNFLDEAPRGRRADGAGRGTSEPTDTPRGVNVQGENASRIPVSICYGAPQRLEQYGVMERLSLVGFRAHRTYWDGPDADSCFHEIVPRLYEGREVLA